MYRKLILLVLCASTVMPAPQQNNDTTTVKQNIELAHSEPELTHSDKESNVETLPLIIAEKVDRQDKEPSENTNNDTDNVNTAQANEKQPTYNYSDRIYSIKTKHKKNNTSTESSILPKEESERKHSVDISKIKDTDIIPAESILTDRLATNEDTGFSSESNPTQSDEFVTEKYEEEATVTTELYIEETTKAPTPRFLPKLSYYGKLTLGSFSKNLIATPGKRRFRSRCRCEKIWNCAKLQISVPRCPEEYFLCCS